MHGNRQLKLETGNSFPATQSFVGPQSYIAWLDKSHTKVAASSVTMHSSFDQVFLKKQDGHAHIHQS
jgi:hypothetical protein